MLPDAELLTTQYLRARVGATPVSTKVPNPRPGTFVRAWRTGGTARNRVLDYAQMTIECWGADKATANQLARQAHALLLDAASLDGIALCRRVESGSLYYDPDPDTAHERYTFTAFLTLRAG
jgi:metal-dependent amidase/aminoacylase/carboxypeptidase family protein